MTNELIHAHLIPGLESQNKKHLVALVGEDFLQRIEAALDFEVPLEGFDISNVTTGSLSGKVTAWFIKYIAEPIMYDPLVALTQISIKQRLKYLLDLQTGDNYQGKEEDITSLKKLLERDVNTIENFGRRVK